MKMSRRKLFGLLAFLQFVKPLAAMAKPKTGVVGHIKAYVSNGVAFEAVIHDGRWITYDELQYRRVNWKLERRRREEGARVDTERLTSSEEKADSSASSEVTAGA